MTENSTMDAFYDELAEILDVERVAPDDKLRSFENWDSLTVLSICALVDSKYRMSLNAGDQEKMETAQELAAFVSSRGQG